MKRTWIVGVLAAGVMIGARFPKLWNGFGGGGGTIPFGSSNSPGDHPKTTDNAAKTHSVALVEPARDDDDDDNEEARLDVEQSVVTVVIAERSFSLRSAGGERSITIDEVVELVKQAVGDADGIRLRIIREPSSRPSAETALQTALTEEGIGEQEVLWVPHATE